MNEQPLTDEQLRLECARLAAVFSNGKGDLADMADALFRYIKEGRNEA